MSRGSGNRSSGDSRGCRLVCSVRMQRLDFFCACDYCCLAEPDRHPRVKRASLDAVPLRLQSPTGPLPHCTRPTSRLTTTTQYSAMHIRAHSHKYSPPPRPTQTLPVGTAPAAPPAPAAAAADDAASDAITAWMLAFACALTAWAEAMACAESCGAAAAAAAIEADATASDCEADAAEAWAAWAAPLLLLPPPPPPLLSPPPPPPPP